MSRKPTNLSMSYRRIVLKLSGEALKPTPNLGIDQAKLDHYAAEIAAAHQAGIEIAVVMGGGNFWRGTQAADTKIHPTEAHGMGMLATVMNSLALRDALRQRGLPTLLMSHLPTPTLCTSYDPIQALGALQARKIVLLGGGLGTAFFSTDTAAVTSALSLQADVLLKGTQVEGVYAADPRQTTPCEHYQELPLAEAYRKELRVMDMTALTLAHEHRLPIIVYNAQPKGYLVRILEGEKIGTRLY